MLRLAWRGVMAHKVRLFLTALAIVLGVAFVSGTLVFTDGIRASLRSIFEDVSQGTDLYVRGEIEFGFQRPPIDEGLVDEISTVAGVAMAVASVEGIAQLIGPDGSLLGTGGAPTLGLSYLPGAESLTPVALRSGRWPAADGEVVIDSYSAEGTGLLAGDTVSVILPTGVEPFVIVGTISFGTADNLLGATLAVFEFTTAQRVLGAEGQVTSISVVLEDGADLDTAQAAIGELLPDGVEVVTSDTQRDESLAQVDEVLGFMNTILLVIAGVGVFVGAFIIQNTFRIIVSQRTRELALLRAVGATGRQVSSLVAIEGLLVGLVASVVGIGVGVLMAEGVKAAFAGFGFGIPSTGVVLSMRTIVVGLAVGVGVTTVSALMPARSASKVPPVAAMRDTMPTSRSLTRRVTIGAVVTGLGALLITVGLVGSTGNGLALVGSGAVIGFIGVSMLAPFVARSFVRVAGYPLRPLFGVVGRLAQENAMRRPRRTAATASALMIGVALVSLIAVFTSSAKAGVSEVFYRDFSSDFQVTTSAIGDPLMVGLPPTLTDELRALPEVDVAARIRAGTFRFVDDPQRELFLAGADGGIHEVASLESEGGDASALGPQTALVSKGSAEEMGLGVGSVAAIEMPSGAVLDLTVAAVFDNPGLGYSLVIDLATLEEHSSFRLDQFVFVRVTDGIDIETARRAIHTVTDLYPNAEVTTSDEFVRGIEEQIDGVMNFMSALLAFAVVIALLGIINTLALSVLERKRELGLLRAVGFRRRQVRRMIRWEAVLIAVFGAALGLVVGVLLGASVVQTVGEGLVLRVPVGTLLVYVLVAALGGVLAAIIPARRAAKLDILEAIAHE